MRFRSGVLGVLSGCLLVATASAQLNECIESSEIGFDHQVSVSTDMTIHWTVDTVNEEITFQAIYEGEGWVSVGFSSAGDMVGSDAVIGLPDESTALEYDLTSYRLVGVTESSTPEISGEAVTQSDSATTLIFTRPLSPTDTSKMTLSAEEGEETIFIWAYGSANALAQHEGWGIAVVGDLFCGEVEDAEEDNDDDDALTETAETCTSSDPDYDFEIAPVEELALFWSLSENNGSVSVKAVYQGAGWLGIGFSDSGNMPGSDSVIGLPGQATALEYDMDNYNRPVESAEQEITNATITQVGGVTTLTFVRLLEPTGDGKQILSVSEDTAWLYAWGGSNTFEEHVRDGSFFLSLSACGVSTAGGGGSKKEYAHAWLMVIGWSVCFPVGIMFARFSESFVQIGFPAHRVLQSLGALLVLVGFFVAVEFTEAFGLEHFDNTHAVMGLFLTIVMMLQIVAAVFRPHALPRGAMVEDADGRVKPAPPSNVRRVWSFLHRALGYIAVIWAVLQCFGGFNQLDVKDSWKDLYTALVAVLVVTFLVLQLAACCKKSEEKQRVRQLSRPQMTAVTGTSH